MWAVGRLSLLSSGLDAAARAKAESVKPLAAASVPAIPKEPAAIPIPSSQPQRPRLDTVPLHAQAQPTPPERPVLKPEPPIAQETTRRVEPPYPAPVKTPVAAPVPVPVAVAVALPAPASVPVPVPIAPEAPVEAPGLLRRIVTRVTRFFRSLFG